MATLAELFATGYKMGESIPREARARAAAKEKYGAAADDPALFSTLQEMEYAKADQGRKDAYLGIAQSQDQRAGSRFEMNKEEHSFKMGGAKAQRKREAALRVVNAMRSARDNGEDLSATFDKLTPMLEEMGVKPADFPALKKQAIENPKILDDYYAALTTGMPASRTTKTSTADAKKAAAEDAAQKGAEGVSQVIKELRTYYTNLEEGGGITNPEKNPVGNVIRWMRSSWAGRLGGAMTGSENESWRRSIEAVRPHLINSLKAMEGLGAKMFDSNKDMEMWLATVSDPSADYATVMRALDVFEQKYGAAMKQLDTAPPEKTPEKVNDAGAATNTIWPGLIEDAVIDGVKRKMRFKGGDPTVKENWEPVE